ncbi:MAG: hypothetical protein ACI94Y_003171 [Maribacter sp.]|jgi:hypothetical protein
MVRNLILSLTILLFTQLTFAQSSQISVVNNDEGMKLVVNGEDFMINGMNWDYFPIGTNFSYSLWKQSDDVIKSALDAEMSLLKNMGVNTVRQYTGVPSKWIKYIYEKHGIYTMLNHSFGRYGLTINGSWVPNTIYGDPNTQELLLAEVKSMTEEYKNTPGLLMYLLGNENNYGLFWGGAETEDIPVEDRKSTALAKDMYKLFNKAVVEMKGIDTSYPIAICNGDLLFLDIIVKECQDIDILGTNMYRGVSFGDAFQKVKDELNKPIMFTEFGADAFSATENKEDQKSQAYYMTGNWKEIYENAAGLGKANNSLGGFTFQFSDGWWKYGQTKNLDAHDNNASWSNGGYQSDFVEGENNMNEEWFGICAKGETNQRGLYELYPRAAYYALKEAHQLNPYSDGVTVESINNYFLSIQLMDALIKARGDKAALIGEKTKKIRLSGLRADISTYYTGGTRISTPKVDDPTDEVFPNRQGFDHMQSFYFGVEAQPTESVRANVNFNVLGNVAQNPINEIFYENRGRPIVVSSPNGNVTIADGNRVAVYNASFSWNSKFFDLEGFYRTGHYHWGYEGDFFGLYPEANYGPNIDIYNGNAPSGFEISGKKKFKGLKVAIGPELWWAANPAVLLKYSREFKGYKVTGIFHEDIAAQAPAVSSFAVPNPVTRRLTLHAAKKFGQLGVEWGGIWGGQPLVGRTFQIADEVEDVTTVYQDEIAISDTWGTKAKVSFSKGPFNWYAQGAVMGLVANGGADNTRTFTGWRLKDSGSSNQVNFLSGFTFLMGDFQIAPNFLWQRPIEDPIPGDALGAGRPRNIIDDPFVVRGGNRETIAGELLISYDPTPATWMYDWDNDMMEDAKFAASLNIIYRHQPTIQDAAIGILGDGRSLFAFPGSAPAQDLWEVNLRAVSKINTDFGIIANIYGGNAQANGDSPRLIKRVGGDLRMIYKNIKLNSSVKINDWGPFDYHRDFNLTFPVQIMFDLSTAVGKQSWYVLPNTRMGVRYIWRTLDQYSNRYCPTHIINAAGDSVCDPEAVGFDNGKEWELSMYFQISIGK